MHFSLRHLVTAIALPAMLALAGPAAAQEGTALTDFDRVLGSPDAPVTIIEYASFTCPHCAAFHTETLPTLKEQYIDTGIARLVFRDFPLDGIALRAGMLARCAADAAAGRESVSGGNPVDDAYFAFIDVLFSTQSKWAHDQDPMRALGQIAGMAGMPGDAVEACLADEALGDQIVDLRLQGEQQFEVNSTPTFVINGEKVSGNMAPEAFGELIDQAAAEG